VLKVKWINKVSNEETVRRISEKELHLYTITSIQQQKLAYAGHIASVSSRQARQLCVCSLHDGGMQRLKQLLMLLTTASPSPSLSLLIADLEELLQCATFAALFSL